jgi:hypothetical protein
MQDDLKNTVTLGELCYQDLAAIEPTYLGIVKRNYLNVCVSG